MFVMRPSIILLAACASGCSASMPSPVNDPVEVRRAEVDLTGAWATGSANEPDAREVVLRPACNIGPAIWLLEQRGDTLRLRFDFGIDGCNGVTGWYVGPITIDRCPVLAGPSLTVAGATDPDGDGAFTLAWARPPGPVGPDELQRHSVDRRLGAALEDDLDVEARARDGRARAQVDADVGTAAHRRRMTAQVRPERRALSPVDRRLRPGAGAIVSA